MAYSTARYAAFMKKNNGRIEAEQNIRPKKQPTPHKSDYQSPSPFIRIANADHGKPGAGLEEFADCTVIAQHETPVALSVSSPVNVKKRPATPDPSLPPDLRRSESPVKLSRTPHGKHVPEITEQQSIRERFAGVSLSAQPSDRPGTKVSADVVTSPLGSGTRYVKGSPLKEERFFNSPDGTESAVLSLRQKVACPTKAESLQGQERQIKGSGLLPINFRILDNISPTGENEDDTEYELPVNTSLIGQPESRPISQDQLTAEVKAIYAGLILIEAKCVHVVNAQAVATTQGLQLDSAHWQAMIALHRNLLHEHHDFLLASQHPSAGQPLRNLALKYSMPARMWKHGIHNFLELLRRRLPHSLEFMLCFIYMAYQMIALLYETVPSFEETWIECLGDLSRYRMAIEDEDQSDRNAWTSVARYWYSKAADKTPTVGRLYHHLAILSRSQALQQLSLYCRSLSTVQVFQSARESIMTLFDPILARSTSAGSRPLSVESWFIRCHALLFMQRSVEVTGNAITTFLAKLAEHINHIKSLWKLQGVYMAISNIASLLFYGSSGSILRELFIGKPTIASITHPNEIEQPLPIFTVPKGLSAWNLIIPTLDLALNHGNKDDTLPHIHIMLVFVWRLILISYASDHLNYEIPWLSICKYLNSLFTINSTYPRIENKTFPDSVKGSRQQLPEDFLIRGLVWSQGYFPHSWFDEISGEDERMVELPMTRSLRSERALWLGVRIASSISNTSHFAYDSNVKQFHQPAPQ